MVGLGLTKPQLGDNRGIPKPAAICWSKWQRWPPGTFARSLAEAKLNLPKLLFPGTLCNGEAAPGDRQEEERLLAEGMDWSCFKQMERFWARRKTPMQRNGYVGFQCLGLVWICFGFVVVVVFPSIWHSCVSWHAMALSWILSSCAHNNIPRLSWGTPAVPMFTSELPKPWVFSPNCRLDLPWLLFFWLWSKMSSCHHLTVFSSNPFFKHRQQLVDLSPSPRTTAHPHIHIHNADIHSAEPPSLSCFALKYKKSQLLISWRARLERLCVYSLSKWCWPF